MKTKQPLKTLAFATALAAIGALGGFVGDAKAETAVDYRTGDRNGLIGLLRPADQANDGAIIAIRPGELLPAVMPTDQKGQDGRAELAAGAKGPNPGRHGGNAGGGAGEHGIIAVLRQGELVPAVMPTDQKGGDGLAEIAAGGGAANGNTWAGSVVLRTDGTIGEGSGQGAGKGGGLTKAGPGTLTLGSLNNVGSTRDLFANSRWGRPGHGLAAASGAEGPRGGGPQPDGRRLGDAGRRRRPGHRRRRGSDR